jgi:uncharacterized protein YjdB
MKSIGMCRRIVWGSLGLLLAACGGGGGDGGGAITPPAPVAVGSVNVTITAPQLFTGGNTSAVAELRSAAGAVLSGRTITWASSAPNVATVDPNGTVIAVAPGAASISATSESRTGSATVTVTLAPVATVVLSIAQPTVIAGTSTTTSVVVRDERGIALTGRVVTYSSSASAVAVVDAAGVITSVAAGSAVITATSEGKTGVAALTVLPPPVATVSVALAQTVVSPGTTTTATAVLRDIQGNALTGRAVLWTSSMPSVATVDAAGVVTAIALGATTISATSESRTGSASLTVQLPPVATITIAGPSVVQPGQSVSLMATLRDASGNVLSDRAITWNTSNGGVAAVSASGIVTGVSPGNVTISATSEGRTGSASLTVSLPPVATVSLSGAARVKVGDSYTYSPTLRLADGTVVTRSITWSITDPAQALVTQGGVVTPVQTGAFTIRLVIDGVTWTSSYVAYDWETLNSSGTQFQLLRADNTITNRSGTAEYPELVVSCSSGFFFVWVRTPHVITSSGLVALSFDNGAPFSQTWDELSPNFTSLWKPGSNAIVKAFSLDVARVRVFGFAFTEFQGPAKAMLFRVTGLTPRLTPLFNACTSTAIIASAEVVAAEFAAQRATLEASVAPRGSAPSVVDLASRRQQPVAAAASMSTLANAMGWIMQPAATHIQPARRQR